MNIQLYEYKKPTLPSPMTHKQPIQFDEETEKKSSITKYSKLYFTFPVLLLETLEDVSARVRELEHTLLASSLCAHVFDPLC